jgi:hypothetical protein
MNSPLLNVALGASKLIHVGSPQTLCPKFVAVPACLATVPLATLNEGK